jgi:hypothetical protein
MSEELKIKVGIDVSDAEKAAQALPAAFDKIDQQNRRDFQRTTGGAINPASLGGGATFPTQTATANQNQQQTAGEREAERIKNAEKKQADEIFKLKMAEYAKKKKLEEQAARDAQEWSNTFVKGLTGGILTSLAPIALFAKGMSMFTDWIGKSVDAGKEINQTAGESGLRAGQIRLARGLQESVGGKEEEGQQLMESMMNKLRNFQMGLSGEGAEGFTAFGLGKSAKNRQRVLSGNVDYNEIQARMSDEFKKRGNDPAFAIQMASMYGEQWKKLIPVFNAGRDVITSDPMNLKGSTISDLFSARNKVNRQRFIKGQEPVSQEDWMGGSQGGGMNSFAIASSLQAMGGGDVLSAISRGPVEKIADNTARGADATERLNKSLYDYNIEMANKNAPAVLVR